MSGANLITKRTETVRERGVVISSGPITLIKVFDALIEYMDENTPKAEYDPCGWHGQAVDMVVRFREEIEKAGP